MKAVVLLSEIGSEGRLDAARGIANGARGCTSGATLARMRRWHLRLRGAPRGPLLSRRYSVVGARMTNADDALVHAHPRGRSTSARWIPVDEEHPKRGSPDLDFRIE